MGNKIRIFIALVVIVGVVFWAVNLVWERSYSGSGIAFKVGSGSVVVTNPGQEPIPVEMRSEGRTASFRIQSTDLDLKASSKRQGSGRDTFHAISFELPSGQAKVDVVQGSNVFFVSGSKQPINAVVTPISASSVRTTLIVSSIIVLAALYYISRTLQHRWFWALRSKLTRRNQQPRSVSP